MSTFDVADVFGFLPDFAEQCTNDTFSCTDLIPPCRSPKGLHFASLWTITQNYYGVCNATGAWLHDTASNAAEDSLALTKGACHAIAGNSWTEYNKADIWSRLTTWKFPLIQLLTSSPRPPLGLWVETLTVLHLAADPIGSLTDLLFKLESCQQKAVFWQTHAKKGNYFGRSMSNPGRRQRLAKAIAIIAESYSELADQYGRMARDTLINEFQLLDDPIKMQALLDECVTTAEALAADRATTFLPVIIAEIIFISVFFIDIIRLQSDNVARATTNTFVNVEMHSIGFSALFFWLITAVMITAVIGTSQTKDAIPRILRRFRKDLLSSGINIALPDLDPGARHATDRWADGGLYTWQPLRRNRRNDIKLNQRVEMKYLQTCTGFGQWIRRALLRIWTPIYLAMPMAIFTCAISTGMLISGFVPPSGWNCRSYGEVYFAAGWIVSYLLSVIIARLPKKWMFATLFAKDLLITALAIVWILVTQVGIYNRCDCYIGNAGLILPEQPNAYAELQRGLRVGGPYVTILVLGILFQVVILPGILWIRYGLAVSVFLQKDSEKKGLDMGL